MTTRLRTSTALSRRTLLKTTAGAAAVSMLGAPALAAKRSIKIGSYGGYFEDSFKKHVYPDFTETTGIEIESVTQLNSKDWLAVRSRDEMVWVNSETSLL